MSMNNNGDKPWSGPEPGHDTIPMPSPYPDHAPGTPPPPSLPPPTTGGWQANGLVNDVPPPQYHYRPPAQRPPPRRRSGGAIIGGIVLAMAFVIVIGVGIVLASTKLSGGGQPGTGNVGATSTATAPTATSVAATATVAATSTTAPTATATLAPTATATMQVGAQTIPPAPSGFGPYIDASTIWGLNIPTGTPITNATVTTPLGGIPQTTFQLDAAATGARFDAFTLPAAVPADQAQTLLNELAQALHATDIVIDSQGTAQLGQNTWQELQIHATLNGNQRVEAYLLYSTHGTGAVAIDMSAPVAGFDHANQQAFQTMITSFTYVTP